MAEAKIHANVGMTMHRLHTEAHRAADSVVDYDYDYDYD
jgi:hypothetical protein